MKIHLIGIGGVAMAGLASIYLEKGCRVQGSDGAASEITQELQRKGAKVFIGHKAENITGDIDLVVYSEAVPEDNPELKQTRKLGIKCLSGAETLAELSKDYFTIAVSGMHGKTTTACMLAHILTQAGLDPTYIIGTKNGSRLGKGKYLVIEADDYKAKFLKYEPEILVLTNIEEEHMDYFQNLNHILKVFEDYVGQVKNTIVANEDDENVVKVLEELKSQNSKVKTTTQKSKLYSLQQKEAKKLRRILKVPGMHNVSNALAALEVARLLGISDGIALKALSEYKGTWRRFEEKDFKIKNLKFKIISDYAHHPTEIAATLKAVKEKYPGKKTWCVFQPHQYQRTFYLFDKFVKVFQQNPLEKLIVIEIYDVTGREEKAIREKVSAEKLAQAIGKNWARFLPKEQVLEYLHNNLKGGEVLVFMGAGADVYNLCTELIHKQV